jgi:hypothetical protein
MVLNQPLISERSFGYGFKPKQNIPESQKTEIWAMENVDWCISMSPMWWKTSNDKWYNLYNGIRDEQQFDHLTKTYGIEFPAGKIKHVPLTRPLINRIHSEIEERQFDFTAHTEDTESIEQKISGVSEQILKEVMTLIASGENLEEALTKMERYYRSEYKSETEIGVQHFINQYMLKHRLDRKFSENALDKLITGREFYRVHVNRIGEDPIYEVLKADELFYSDNAVKWVNECDWAVRAKLMTPTEILDSFGERMKQDDIKKIESWLDMYTKDTFYKMNRPEDADTLLADSSKAFDNAAINHKLAVYFVEWKSIRKISYLKNENKYAQDAPFIKILSNEEVVELPKSRRDKVKCGYVQDLYQGIRIGDGGSQGIYLDLGKVKYPVRSMSQPSKVFLSYNGLTHNGKIKPYSLIGETSDLQDLYDVLHFHKENLIALSGVKGSVMDMSQLPDFKTGNPADNIKLYMYYKKLGTAWIDRNKEGADRSFNQFATYDDTMGAGLKAILEMIQHVEDVAGRVVGVNRQQLGSNEYFDGKATTQMMIQNSSMVTEWLFNEHDEFVERALTDLSNAARVAYKNGVVGHYTDRQRQQQIFRLDDVNFPFADWGIHITNKSSDKRSIAELKMMTTDMVKKGLMQFRDILPLFKQNGLAEVLREIEITVIKREEEMAKQQAQLQQIQIQLAQAKEEAEIKKLNSQAQEIASNMLLNQRQLELERQAISDKRDVGMAKIDNDNKRIQLEAQQLEIAARQGIEKNNTEVRNK